ncbi:MAG: type II secretion system F family protein [Rhodospirillaceae bacterium]|nr:type II secretion system F family protein [Rhodospirillaceae bacterium]
MSAQGPHLGVVLLVAMLGLFLVAVILLFSDGGSKQRARRIGRVSGRPEDVVQAKAARISISRNQAYSSIQLFDALIRRLLPNPGKLRLRLARTGRKITLGQYLGVCVAMLVIGTLAARFVLPLPAVSAPFVGAFLGLGVPHFVVGRLVKRRAAKFTDLFPQAIDLIVRGLKSGLPVTESFRTVGSEIADPVGLEFRLIADAIRFGQTLNDALWAAAVRIDVPEFRFFIIALSIQQETGGNLAETLENLSQVLRRRRQMKLKIKAFSSEAKASAYIIGSLPFIMFFLIMMTNRGYAMQLLTDPRGLVMLGLGLASFGAGIVTMAKMIRFDI